MDNFLKAPDTRNIAYNAAINAIKAIYVADNAHDASEILANHLHAAFTAGCTHCAADAVAQELVYLIAEGLAARGELAGSASGELVAKMDALIDLKRQKQRKREARPASYDFATF